MLFVYLLFSLVFPPAAVSIQVHLSTGTIEGKTLTATYSPLGNQTARVFLGIPYATPPIGNLRFKKPQPHEKWEGVLETKEYKSACMSNATRTYKKGGIQGTISEDCLFLNVFTNDYCLENKNCAVMIAVHGGAFLYESASAFNPEILINNFVGQDRNIIVVSVNYRLGVFGFGQFHGDLGSSGDRNIGLFDLLHAIKWVRKEIGNFGGDKNRITLTGHSAGAALTLQVTSSPLSKGLLHQQIIMSGPLPNLSKQNNYKGMTAVAMHLGCLKEEYGFGKLEKEVVEKTYQCLREVSAQELLDAQLYILKNTTYCLGSPYVDGEFVIDYPDRLFDKKSISPITTMLGTTSGELRESQFINDPEHAYKKQDLHRNFCEHIGYEVYSKPEIFSQNCYDYYKNGTDVQFLSDDYEFYSGAVNMANAHVSPKTKVFLYSYEYSGAGAAFDKYMPEVPSPHHSEDLIYVFGTHRAVMAPKDYVIEQIYSGMFANFINFGDPIGSKDQEKWTIPRKYSKKNRDYFLIDFDQNFTMPGMRQGYYQRAVDFWINAGYQRHHKETWAPSLDTQIITNLVNPIVTYLTGHTKVLVDDRALEQNLKMYEEREQFLVELKEKRKAELEAEMNPLERKGKFPFPSETEQEDGGVNILLVIFSGTLLLGILYLTITHFCLHRRSREGYQLLK